MTGDVKLSGITNHATAYHSVDVAPVWASGMIETAQIGNHVFYKRDLFAQTRLAQAGAKAIETISGFFSQAAIAPLEASLPPEDVQAQVQIPEVLRDGA